MKITTSIIFFTLISCQIFGQTMKSGTATAVPPAHSHFGWNVAVFGEFAAVSAPNENCDSLYSVGAVYIYHYVNNDWEYFQKIVPSDPSNMKLFGSSINMYGFTLLVGAPNDRGKMGAVYAYKFNGSAWVKFQKISSGNNTPMQMFGTTVDIHSNYAIISTTNSDNPNYATGLVYIYRVTPDALIQEAVLKSPTDNENDLFGASATIFSSDHIIIGAPRGHGKVDNSGVVYSFVKTNGKWVENQKIYSADGSKDGLFGCSGSTSKNRLLIGAMQEAVDSVTGGAVYLYKLNKTNKWDLEQKINSDDEGHHDYFGIHVLLDGDVALVGSPKWEDATHSHDIGCVDLYCFKDSLWTLSKKIVPQEGSSGDHYGMAIATYNSSLVIGSRLDDNGNDNNGSAHFYDLAELLPEVKETFIPEKNSLTQNFPNPFKQFTTISYNLHENTHVSLAIYDLQGQKIKDLINGEEAAGYKQASWNGKDSNGNMVAPGVYLYRIETSGFRESKQLIYMK